MTGYVDDVLRRAMMSIVVRGPFGWRQLEAVVDTGFNGYLAIPDGLPSSLGLARQGRTFSRLADGRLDQSRTFIGEVDWVTGPVRCQVIETKLSHALVGTGLLMGLTLSIDFGAAKTVEVR